MSPFKSNYRVCLLKTFLIENSESIFSSLQMPEMSTWYNSLPGIDSMLNWLSCSISSVSSIQGFKFIVILRGFFPQLTCYMTLDMANSDASSVTVKVVVSFYLVATDESSSSVRSSPIQFNVPLRGDEPNDLSNIVKHSKTFTGLAKIAKDKGLREKPEVTIIISCSFLILRCKKLFLFVGTLTEKHA